MTAEFIVRHAVLPLAWAAFAAYWFRGVGSGEPLVRRPHGRSQYAHVVLIAAAVVLMLADLSGLGLSGLGGPFAPLAAVPRTWPPVPVLVLVLGGLALAVWARAHLGRFWSAEIGSKAGHELVQSGPYARLRHPIYTGLVAAVAGTAMADMSPAGLAAAAAAIAVLVAKLRREEAWLHREFGPAWAAYRRRTWALVPLLF